MKLVYFIRTPEVFDSFKACIKECHVLNETKRRVLLRQINVFHYHWKIFEILYFFIIKRSSGLHWRTSEVLAVLVDISLKMYENSKLMHSLKNSAFKILQGVIKKVFGKLFETKCKDNFPPWLWPPYMFYLPYLAKHTLILIDKKLFKWFH